MKFVKVVLKVNVYRLRETSYFQDGGHGVIIAGKVLPSAECTCSLRRLPGSIAVHGLVHNV